jgi:hypothetical protein
MQRSRTSPRDAKHKKHAPEMSMYYTLLPSPVVLPENQIIQLHIDLCAQQKSKPAIVDVPYSRYPSIVPSVQSFLLFPALCQEEHISQFYNAIIILSPSRRDSTPPNPLTNRRVQAAVHGDVPWKVTPSSQRMTRIHQAKVDHHLAIRL